MNIIVRGGIYNAYPYANDTVLITIDYISFTIRQGKSPILFVFKSVLAMLEPLHFLTDFRISWAISIKESTGIFAGILLNL